MTIVEKGTAKPPSAAPGADDQPRIEFHFIKSNMFRVIHSDGVWGGIAPNGLLHISFFSERPAIPTRLVHELTPQSTVGAEIAREGRNGLVREVDADIVMTIETAKLLHDWLEAKIAEFNEMQAAIQLMQKAQSTGAN